MTKMIRIICNNTGRESKQEARVARLIDPNTIVLLQDTSKSVLERIMNATKITRCLKSTHEIVTFDDNSNNRDHVDGHEKKLAPGAPPMTLVSRPPLVHSSVQSEKRMKLGKGIAAVPDVTTTLLHRSARAQSVDTQQNDQLWTRFENIASKSSGEQHGRSADTQWQRILRTRDASIAQNNVTLIPRHSFSVDWVARIGCHDASALATMLTARSADNSSVSGARPSRYLIVNLYLRPRARHDQVDEVLSQIEKMLEGGDELITHEWQQQHGNERRPEAKGIDYYSFERVHGEQGIIIMGDTNASNILWDSVDKIMQNKRHASEAHYRNVKDVRGLRIANFILENNLICLNSYAKEPTCNDACVDLAIVSKSLHNGDTEVYSKLRVAGRLHGMHEGRAVAAAARLKVAEAGIKPNVHKIMILILDSALTDIPRGVSKPTKVHEFTGKRTRQESIRGDPLAAGHSRHNNARRRRRRKCATLWRTMFSGFDAGKTNGSIHLLATTEFKRSFARMVGDFTVAETDLSQATSSVLNANGADDPAGSIGIGKHDWFHHEELQDTLDSMTASCFKSQTRIAMSEKRLRIHARLITHACPLRCRGSNRHRYVIVNKRVSWLAVDIVNALDKARRRPRLLPRWKREGGINWPAGASQHSKDWARYDADMHFRDFRKKTRFSEGAKENYSACKERQSETDVDKLIIESLSTELLTRDGRYVGIRVSDQEIKCAMEDYTRAERLERSLMKKKEIRIFNVLTKHAFDEIAFIIKQSFRLTYIPKLCQVSEVSVRRARDRRKYRLVYSSKPLCTIMETIALRRLQHKLNSGPGLMSPSQFGLTALRDKQDLMARIIELSVSNHWGRIETRGARAKGQLTSIVSIRLREPYDNLDQDALVRKLLTHLSEGDTLPLWLSKFILNRRVRSVGRIPRHEQQRRGALSWQEPMLLQTGVPRDSTLAATLLNFAINDIERINQERVSPSYKIEIPGTRELLRFGPNLYLVQKGYDRSTLQKVLNQVANNLAGKGLEVDTDRCRVMVLRYTQEGRNTKQHKYTIDQRPLKLATKSLNIEGMHMTPDLHLAVNKDLTISKTSGQIKAIIQRLCKQVYLNTDLSNTWTAREWRALMKLLRPVLITNNWPLLVVSVQSRQLIDTLYCRIAKIILNWPASMTNRAVRFLTRWPSCQHSIERILTTKLATSEMRNTFILMMKVLKETQVSSQRGNRIICTQHTPESLSLQLNIERKRYGDPRNYMSFKRWVELDSNEAKCERTFANKQPGHTFAEHTADAKQKKLLTQEAFGCWIIVELETSALAILLQQHKQIHHYKVTHNRYPSKHWSVFTLIWNLVSQQPSELCSKKILMSSESSVVRCLRDHNNYDWRIIEMREKIKTNQWLIIITGSHSPATHSLIWPVEEHDASELEHARPETHEFELPQTCVQLDVTQQPDLSDKWRLLAMRQRSIEQRNYEMDHLTPWICKSFVFGDNLNRKNLRFWWRIPLKWLAGHETLLLSDILRSSTTGQLTQARNETYCAYCSTRLKPDQHPVGHRITSCSEYNSYRKAFSNLVLRHGDGPHPGKIYFDETSCGEALRLLSHCALH